MIERLGCELDQVWLTLAIISMPLILILAIPEELRGFLIIFAILALLLPFAPYSVEVRKTGISVISFFVTTNLDWEDILSVRYNNTFQLMTIKTDKKFVFIPFGIWIHTRAPESHFMLMDYLNKNVDISRIRPSNLF